MVQTKMAAGDSEKKRKITVEKSPKRSKVEELKSVKAKSELQKSTSSSAPGGLWQKYQNMVIRSTFGVGLICLFGLILYGGIPCLCLMLISIVFQCFREVINVGHSVYQSKNIPWCRVLNWYFLFVITFLVNGQIFSNLILLCFRAETLIGLISKHNTMVFFALFMFGIILFVMSLKKHHYRVQFALFSWCQIALMVLMLPLYCVMRNLLTAPFWVLMPSLLIISNDTFAYFCGFFFGKTPLIKLSPKKTLEGFIGGGICTLIISVFLCNWMCRYQYFYCPAEFSVETKSFISSCDRSVTFREATYAIPEMLTPYFSMFGLSNASSTLTFYPAYIHSFVMALFASLIGPFGGFFASGFKRAFNIKDFGDTIPGHGGIMDRMDCQVLTVVFVYIYTQSFILSSHPEKLMDIILSMDVKEQIHIYEILRESLLHRNYIGA